MGERTEPRSRIARRLPISRVGRYDLVLAIIPTVLVAAVVAGHLLSLSLHVAVAVGSLLCALTLADALFLDPPQAGGAG